MKAAYKALLIARLTRYQDFLIHFHWNLQVKTKHIQQLEFL